MRYLTVFTCFLLAANFFYVVSASTDELPDPSIGLRPLNGGTAKGQRAITRYYVSTFKTTWTNAEKYCRSSGRALVSIEDDVEQGELTIQLAAGGYADRYYWTSLNDIMTEGRFTWFSTGEDLLWPNFASDFNSDAFDCVYILNADFQFKWQVGPCTATFEFVCETFS